MRFAPVLLLIVGGIFLLVRQTSDSRDRCILGEKLCQAVIRGDLDESRRLIEQGAPASAVSTESGNSALMMAVMSKDRQIMRLLLDHGADVNSRNIGGFTALMLAACVEEDPTLVQELLRAGSDVNATSYHGTTALIIARQRGDEATVRLLLAAGARPAVPQLLTVQSEGRQTSGMRMACASFR